VGVDDEGGGGGGQDPAEVAVRAPVDEEAAERGCGGEGVEEVPGPGGGGDGVDGEADGVGGEDVGEDPDGAERIGVGGRGEDQERGGGARGGAEARVEGVDPELAHHGRRCINRGMEAWGIGRIGKWGSGAGGRRDLDLGVL